MVIDPKNLNLNMMNQKVFSSGSQKRSKKAKNKKEKELKA